MGIWKKILLAIPKNLVYIFVGIVFFAFGAMCYITYTEKDLTTFLNFEKDVEVVVVDPIYQTLRDSLKSGLPKHTVLDVNMTDFSVPLFFNAGLRENRPMVIYDYAKDWTATEKWSDKDYLASTAGISFVQLNTYAT